MSVDLPWDHSRIFSPRAPIGPILVIGIGGGSDGLMAQLFAKHTLPPSNHAVVLANTKRRAEDDWEFLSSHIAKLPAKQLQTTGSLHGSTALDRIAPTSHEKWVVLLQSGAVISTVAEQIKTHAFSHIYALDTGGDVLSVFGRKKVGKGRDRQMLEALRLAGVPLTLLVAGPGSDGDFTTAQLRGRMQHEEALERFLGACSLAPWGEDLQKFASDIPEKRTPRIILGALERSQYDPGGSVDVPRGLKPEIPVSWLTTLLAYDMSS